MSERTGIEWCDHTFNIAWGCTKISAGCANCYAVGDALKYGYDVWGADKGRRTFGEKHWKEPLRWNRDAAVLGQRRRVFTSSMADVFEDNPIIEKERRRLRQMILKTRRLDWMVLTKRSDVMRRVVCAGEEEEFFNSNVWLGVSVEDRASLHRITDLQDTLALNRFLSIEPLLEEIDLTPWLPPLTHQTHVCRTCFHNGSGEAFGAVKRHSGVCPKCDGTTIVRLMDGEIHQVIVGGESGPNARPCAYPWIQTIVRQCEAAGVAVFVKQVGANPVMFPPDCVFTDPKGKHLHEMPADIQKRQYP